mmetsp:Transcript_14832/g.39362  ORF Transcript_14832/g.39362 Transcript_14832/m.39362 type:complete len:302 (-) Transcript_14832:208-1113(-)
MSHPAKWPSQPTQCPQLPSHTSVTCCFLGPACAPCGIRARMARVASDSAACRPGSTRALPEAATALTLAILPWNGCDQSLNSYACGGTGSSRLCQSMYQAAMAAEPYGSFRQAAVQTLPAPPVHDLPQPSIPSLPSAATVQQLNCGSLLSDSKSCSNSPRLAFPSLHLAFQTYLTAYDAKRLQMLLEAGRIGSMRSGLEGSTSASLVPVRGRGACADVQPCEPDPGAGNGSRSTNSLSTSSPGAAGPGEDGFRQEDGAAQARTAAAERLSDEARGFLRDELDSQLQRRTREFTEAAWQTLE